MPSNFGHQADIRYVPAEPARPPNRWQQAQAAIDRQLKEKHRNFDFLMESLRKEGRETSPGHFTLPGGQYVDADLKKHELTDIRDRWGYHHDGTIWDPRDMWPDPAIKPDFPVEEATPGFDFQQGIPVPPPEPPTSVQVKNALNTGAEKAGRFMVKGADPFNLGVNDAVDWEALAKAYLSK